MQDDLRMLADEIRACTACPLHRSARQAVPGEGSAESGIFFLGEAPGYNEDLQGRPFVGAAGLLLDELLSDIGLDRSKVFITNVVRHRPPENRDPLPEEIAKESGLEVKRVHELFDLVEDPVSLETPVGDGDSLYGDMLEDENSEQPDTVLAELLRGVELQEALASLNERMRHVLELRFGMNGQIPKTLEEVGTELGVTRERVRQLESRALRELQSVAPELRLYLRTE